MALHPAGTWAAAVAWMTLVVLTMWAVPSAAVATWPVAVALGLFGGVLLYAGVASTAGYHRSHRPLPRALWHVSPTDWVVGEVIDLDPSKCRARSRMHSITTTPLRPAIYLFRRNPSQRDLKFNRPDATFVYELDVPRPPTRHYRRLDNRAIAFTDPVQVRITKKRSTR